eukprot:1524475-Pyramimonas_sp.AAC.1
MLHPSGHLPLDWFGILWLTLTRHDRRPLELFVTSRICSEIAAPLQARLHSLTGVLWLGRAAAAAVVLTGPVAVKLALPVECA